MKKILVMMIVSCLMMICSVSFAAADDHKALGKQLAVAEKMMDAFDGEPVPLFAQVSAGFSPNLKKAVDEKAFTDVKKQVRQKFGVMKEVRFVDFQRSTKVDRVTYVASFSKEKIVSMIFFFDKQNKLLNFSFNALQQLEAKSGKELVH
jgi:hypothetical protein